jgi:hypothetical protein
MIYIAITLIIVSAACKAIQDKLQFHFDVSVFKNLGSWWNPEESWRLKWKDSTPLRGERFLGSSTVFVSLTDAWHLFGLIRNFSLVLAIGLLMGYWWYVIVLYVIYVVVFHVLFTYLFKK